MEHHASHSIRRTLGSNDGVALPLALIGLVAVTFIVTGVLLTSGTEAAISSAQRGAKASLYQTESAVQGHIAENTDQLLDIGLVNYSDDIDVGVAQLSETPTGDGGVDYVFAVTGSPSAGASSGGRSVVALIRQLIPPPPQTKIEGAATIGGDLHADGNAFTISGHSQDLTCGESVYGAAATTASDFSSTGGGSHLDNIEGVDESGNEVSGEDAIKRTTASQEELVEAALGGWSLEDFIAVVPEEKKWGPRFGRPAFDGTLEAEEKVAVVDADGGTVNVTGGEGLLIIVNGNLEMSGESTFIGIIIVEGTFSLRGTPTVQGSIISMGVGDDGTGNVIDLDANAEVKGHVTIQYDACAIADAMADFQETRVPTTGPTFAWFEVIR
ncbi:MAG: hypothetical protein ACREKN_09695 [Longimicrobiaceae bacterium]